MDNLEQLEFLVDYYNLLKKKNEKQAYTQFQHNIRKLSVVGEINKNVYNLVNSILTFSTGISDKAALLEYIKTFVTIVETPINKKNAENTTANDMHAGDRFLSGIRQC